MGEIIDIKDLETIVSEFHKTEQNIVFTNGCFDILHPGHVDYLAKAKKLGNILIVGVNADESVKRLKGETRPINNFSFRSNMLAALSAVDYVVEFADDTPKNLIEKINPHVLVKGGDYTEDNIVGAEFVKSNGGTVEIISFLEGYSSSSIISKIRSLT